MDTLTVLAEATAAAAEAAARTISASELSTKVKDAIGVSIRVSVADPGGVARSQGKAVRIVDNRPRD